MDERTRRLRQQKDRHGGCGHSPISPALPPPRLPAWRSRLLLAIFFVAFASLIARAAWIQVINQPFYAEQGRKRFARVVDIPAARGNIVDRRGVLLAISRPMRTVYAMPAAFDQPLDAPRTAQLAALLSMPVDIVSAKLNNNRSFIYLKRRVTLDVGKRIDALGIPEVRTDDAWERFYPDGPASAQVVGFTDIDGKGIEGVEASMEAQLHPAIGKRAVIRNRMGAIVEGEMTTPPTPGTDVHLTIDARLQQAAFDALRHAVEANQAEAGGAVVIDARNGEIRALANWPSFDPADRRGRRGGDVRNRVVTDVFEPGSTIKPIHVAQALERGWVTPTTIFDTSPGRLRLGRFTVTDTSPRAALTVQGILRYSSNVGMVRMMQNEPADAMWQSLHEAGFGVVPLRDFPGAAAGQLRPVSAWSGIDQAALSYGYGVSVSLLQLAHAYTMFGDTGTLLPLSLVQTRGGALEADNTGQHPQLSPHTAWVIRHLLEGVTEANGTARLARVDDFRVGAKTGTSKKPGARGYLRREYLATAVGVAPVDHPRFVVAVMIDRPQGRLRGGGTVAAPALSVLMRAALHLENVPPDSVARADAGPMHWPAEPGNDSGSE